jgi:hypothetical protein
MGDKDPCTTVSTPRRHHFVQRAYLERFAEEGLLYVRRRDSTTFRSSPVNVAVETGFYDISDVSGNRSTVEEILATIEGPAMAAMSRIDVTGRPPAPGTSDRAELTRYFGLQATRTPETRERIFFARRVAEYAGNREVTRELVAEYLEKVHLDFRPSENEASAAFDFVKENLKAPETQTREFAIGMMLESMGKMAPILHDMWWTLESDRKARLITSDTPLIVWRQPSPRDEFEGVGITNAEEIRFPLDPSKQLVLSRRERTGTARIESTRVRECNADVASACHRFVVAHPRNSDQADSVELTSRRPVIRFNSGPLYSAEGDRLDGDVLHTWVPRRQSRR